MFNRKRILIVMGSILVAILLFTVLVTCSSQSGDSSNNTSSTAISKIEIVPESAPPAVLNLNGNWTAKVSDVTFDVLITDTTVMVKMGKSGQFMLYWYGSFSSSASVGQTITSDKLDIDKAVLSGADKKAFFVKKDTLLFDVSAMGRTRTIEVTHA